MKNPIILRISLLVTLLCVTLLTLQAQPSQNVSGKVVDANSQAVWGAAVTV